MNLIDRLKELEAKAKAVPYQPGNIDERTDTAESFDFAYALQDAWPKLLAVVEAAEELSPTCSDPIFLDMGRTKFCGQCPSCCFYQALDAMDQ